MPKIKGGCRNTFFGIKMIDLKIDFRLIKNLDML